MVKGENGQRDHGEAGRGRLTPPSAAESGSEHLRRNRPRGGAVRGGNCAGGKKGLWGRRPWPTACQGLKGRKLEREG